MNKLTLELKGMGCGGCIKNVRKALDALPGVAVQNVAVGSAELAYDPAHSSPQVIIEALTKAGYPAQEAVTGAATSGIASQGGHCGL